jgi:hypothetical protein
LPVRRRMKICSAVVETNRNRSTIKQVLGTTGSCLSHANIQTLTAGLHFCIRRLASSVDTAHAQACLLDARTVSAVRFISNRNMSNSNSLPWITRTAELGIRVVFWISNVTDASSYIQHYLNMLNFLKKFSTTCFGSYDNHHVSNLLWCWNCCANLVLFLVRLHVCAGIFLGDESLSLCVLLCVTITAFLRNIQTYPKCTRCSETLNRIKRKINNKSRDVPFAYLSRKSLSRTSSGVHEVICHSEQTEKK